MALLPRCFTMGSTARKFFACVLAGCTCVFAHPQTAVRVDERAGVRCEETPGTDFASKLTSCVAALPAAGGILDTSGITGRQELRAPVMIPKPAHILVGCSTWVLSAEIRVSSSNVEFSSLCSGKSILQRAPGYAGRLLGYTGPGHAGLRISGLIFDNSNVRVKNDDDSVMVYLHSGNNDSFIHHNRFVRVGTGRVISSGGYSKPQSGVRIEDNEISSGPKAKSIADTGLIRSAGVVTLVTTSSHGITPGTEVYVSGTRDGTFAGVFLILSTPSPLSMTYAQVGKEAHSGGGVVVPTNLRAISLGTPGFNVRVNRNTISGAGSITLEPSSESADGDIEVCGNHMRDVDATNILIRTHDHTTVSNIKVCDNELTNAGLNIGKGCIAVGENTGKDAASAVFRHVTVTGNACRGWGNWPNSSVGIGVAGSIVGSSTEDVIVDDNILDARRSNGTETQSGYGIFVRNNTESFQIRNNKVAFSGRSCIATTHARGGRIEQNICEHAVRWAGAKQPDPAHEACFQVDIDSEDINLTRNTCSNAGTPAGPANGIYVADSATVRSIVLEGNSVLMDALEPQSMRQAYSIGPRANDVRMEEPISEGSRPDPEVK